MKGLRSLFAGLVLGLPGLVAAEDMPEIVISDDLGVIEVATVFGSWDFLVPAWSAGSDSSWGGLNDADRNFRLFAQHPEGGDLFLSVSYDYGPMPEIWLHLVRPNDATSYGGTSEGMDVEIVFYELLPPVDGQVMAVVEGRFDGDLQDEFGRRADVDGWFEAQVPRVAFSISLPEPDPEPETD